MSTTTKDKPKRGRGRPRKTEAKTPQTREVTAQELFKMINDHPEFQKRLGALLQAKKRAKNIKETAEARAIEIESEIQTGDPYAKGKPQVADYTLESAEKAVARPTVEQLIFKRQAYRKVAEAPYKVNKEYRAAAAEYYNYLAPTLKGLEREFRQALHEEAKVEKEYIMAKTYWRSRQHDIEGMIVALFGGTHDSGRRTASNPSCIQSFQVEGPLRFNYPKYDHINADDLARKLAEEYRKPVPSK